MSDETALEDRIVRKATELWEQDGRPQGREADYRDMARELISQADMYLSTTIPVAETLDTPVEPIESLENQGEFPTLTDQGEAQPPRR